MTAASSPLSRFSSLWPARSVAAGVLVASAIASAQTGDGATPQTGSLQKVPSARFSFHLPPGFERDWIDPSQRATRPRQYVGKIAGRSARIIVQLGPPHFSTVSRSLAARAEDGPIESFRVSRIRGEPLCVLRRRISGENTEIHEAICCPERRAVSLAILFEQAAPANARNLAQRVLDTFELLPQGAFTRAAIPDTQREQKELAVGFHEKQHARVRILESEHYRLYSTAAGGRKLLDLLETELLPKLRPLAGGTHERSSLGKLPIFLHRTRRSYLLAALQSGIPRSQATAMEAHAWDSFFSASYVSPSDPVLLHEAAHQYMTAALGLDGGGPWLQEGFARWIESMHSKKRPERTAHNLLQRGQLPSLRELLKCDSLFRLRVDGRKLSANAAYDVAASLIAFLHDRDPEQLRSLVLQAGVLPGGELRLLSLAVRQSLGLGISELEAAWHTWLRR